MPAWLQKCETRKHIPRFKGNSRLQTELISTAPPEGNNTPNVRHFSSGLHFKSCPRWLLILRTQKHAKSWQRHPYVIWHLSTPSLLHSGWMNQETERRKSNKESALQLLTVNKDLQAVGHTHTQRSSSLTVCVPQLLLWFWTSLVSGLSQNSIINVWMDLLAIITHGRLWRCCTLCHESGVSVTFGQTRTITGSSKAFKSCWIDRGARWDIKYCHPGETLRGNLRTSWSVMVQGIRLWR